jgi:hypothetical protein
MEVEKNFWAGKMTIMKNKPVIFTVLTILCFIEPIMKVLYFKVTTHFELSVIMGNLLVSNSLREVFDFWLIFPLAGLLIMKLRRWTYFAFMGILAYIVYTITTYESYSWPYNSDQSLFYHYAVISLVTGIFVAFLSPKMRGPFFDRRIRLWECMERFPVRVQCTLGEGGRSHTAELLNISRTGAFLCIPRAVEASTQTMLSFTYAGLTIEVPVEVVHAFPFNQQPGYGVRFHFKSLAQYFKVAWVMRELKGKNHSATVKIKAA